MASQSDAIQVLAITHHKGEGPGVEGGVHAIIEAVHLGPQLHLRVGDEKGRKGCKGWAATEAPPAQTGTLTRALAREQGVAGVCTPAAEQ